MYGQRIRYRNMQVVNMCGMRVGCHSIRLKLRVRVTVHTIYGVDKVLLILTLTLGNMCDLRLPNELLAMTTNNQCRPMFVVILLMVLVVPAQDVRTEADVYYHQYASIAICAFLLLFILAMRRSRRRPNGGYKYMVGDVVQVRSLDCDLWETATVHSTCTLGGSYKLKMSDGRLAARICEERIRFPEQRILLPAPSVQTTPVLPTAIVCCESESNYLGDLQLGDGDMSDRSHISGTPSTSSSPVKTRYKRRSLSVVACGPCDSILRPSTPPLSPIMCCESESNYLGDLQLGDGDMSDRSHISGTPSTSSSPVKTRYKRRSLSVVACDPCDPRAEQIENREHQILRPSTPPLSSNEANDQVRLKLQKVIQCASCGRQHAICEQCPCGPKSIPPYGPYAPQAIKDRKTRKIRRRKSAAEVETDRLQEEQEDAMLDAMTVDERNAWRASDACPVRMAIRFPGGRHRAGDWISSEEVPNPNSDLNHIVMYCNVANLSHTESYHITFYSLLVISYMSYQVA